MSYDKEDSTGLGIEEMKQLAQGENLRIINGGYMKLEDRVDKTLRDNMKHNQLVDAKLVGEYLTVNPIKIEHKILNGMKSKKGVTQSSRRKLIRSNPHLLHGKYAKHKK